MPAVSALSIDPELVTNTINVSEAGHVLQVVCAWPVSSQYGPGSRFLYYVLVAACVLARKEEWLRNACLAAALILPAVAACHGIALAAVHVDGAVDMDVYGAFQLCTIGILAAPVTVKKSTTYFQSVGRNIIFLWTGLVLSGLLALTVELYRSDPVPCPYDPVTEQAISPRASLFPYGNASCGLICNTEDGPFSSMRGGSANNIYVIPAPTKLTLNTATLMAAACCIPAILSLVTMWNKILEVNWNSRFGGPADTERIEGTRATVREMRVINEKVRKLLSGIEIPVYGAAVFAILVMGETNFFSRPVRFEIEPMVSIGQWGTLAGTGLAFFGSVYLLLAEGIHAVEEGQQTANLTSHQRLLSHQNDDAPRRPASIFLQQSTDGHEAHRGDGDHGLGSSGDPGSPRASQSNAPETRRTRSLTFDSSRHKVAWFFNKIADLGTPDRDLLPSDEFKNGRAGDFPMIPGERERNSRLSEAQRMWGKGGELSRVSSLNGSVALGLGETRPRSQHSSADDAPSSTRGPGSPSTPSRLCRPHASSLPPRHPPSFDVTGMQVRQSATRTAPLKSGIPTSAAQSGNFAFSVGKAQGSVPSPRSGEEPEQELLEVPRPTHGRLGPIFLSRHRSYGQPPTITIEPASARASPVQTPVDSPTTASLAPEPGGLGPQVSSAATSGPPEDPESDREFG